MKKYDLIRKICKEHGITISQMERDLGFSKGSVSKIDSHKPSVERVAMICNYLHISPMFLFVNEAENIEDFDDAVKYTDAINSMPPTEISVGAGNGRINEEYESMSEHPIIRICGDSMEPSLHDGDLVKMRHATNASPSDYAIIKINGDECCCKHVETTDTGIWIRSENKAYEDVFYSVKDILSLPVTIIGIAEEIVSRKL